MFQYIYIGQLENEINKAIICFLYSQIEVDNLFTNYIYIEYLKYNWYKSSKQLILEKYSPDFRLHCNLRNKIYNKIYF